ncbi:MAG: hypothetical protein ABIK81_00920 [candidate division WOR-3 bacterium]
MPYRKYCILFFLFLAFVFLTCAPGNSRWHPDFNPGHKAGFWAGLWHGLIIVITFIVSLFTKEVGIYEVNNVGWAYNLGFLLGAASSLGGALRITKRKRKEICSRRKEEWEEIGKKIEESVREGLKTWLKETERAEKEKEWEEIGKKIEEKIKKILKEWTSD